jgi:vanadium-dependent haloperoxidase-like protein
MFTIPRKGFAAAILCLLAPCAFAQDAAGPQSQREFLGPSFDTNPSTTVIRVRPLRRYGEAAETLRYWNQIAVNASGLDHTPLQPGETRRFGEQLGPGRSARAMAIVHIAIFDALNSILGGYRSYTGVRSAPRTASLDAAIAQAAHDTLVAMFPSQAPSFGQLLTEDLVQAQARDGQAKADGIAAGKRAAAAILAMRGNDNSAGADPQMGTEWETSDDPGRWRQDPIGMAPVALGAKWGDVRPFVLRSGAQFRAPAPPSMQSRAYTRAFAEVAALGGDGVTTPTRRTEEQTQIGIYWAYDGTPSLCAPPRLYNQIATEVSKRSNNVMALARLLALVNVAMADSGVAIWESKFYYDFWRPVGGVREASQGTGPSGAGDGNPATAADPRFTPLGAPASNLTGPNFTPPFPSYPSGHAGFGGALFQVLRRFYGTDAVPFTFVSDELNGVTVANDGSVRPLVPRSFSSFSQAEEENGQSRIYLGIHWEFDKTQGIAQGRRVANYVFDNAFRPVR